MNERPGEFEFTAYLHNSSKNNAVASLLSFTSSMKVLTLRLKLFGDMFLSLNALSTLLALIPEKLLAGSALSADLMIGFFVGKLL